MPTSEARNSRRASLCAFGSSNVAAVSAVHSLPARFPHPFERRIIFALDVARDFAGSAWHPPVDPDCATRFLFVIVAKGPAEFVADLFVVRRDDDDGIIRFRKQVVLGLQRERNGDDERKRGEDGQNCA